MLLSGNNNAKSNQTKPNPDMAEEALPSWQVTLWSPPGAVNYRAPLHLSLGLCLAGQTSAGAPSCLAEVSQWGSGPLRSLCAPFPWWPHSTKHRGTWGLSSTSTFLPSLLKPNAASKPRMITLSASQVVWGGVTMHPYKRVLGWFLHWSQSAKIQYGTGVCSNNQTKNAPLLKWPQQMR